MIKAGREGEDMNSKEIKDFKKYVVQQIITKYHIDEMTAFKAVRDSYLSQALKRDLDYVMHDTVEEWADYVYNEMIEEELLQM